MSLLKIQIVCWTSLFLFYVWIVPFYKLLYTKERLCFLPRLNSTYRQLLKDNENLQLDHKNIKSQLNSAKLEQTKLEAEFSKLKEQYQQLDITSTKLTNQCEVGSHPSLFLDLGFPLNVSVPNESRLSKVCCL